MKTFDDFLETHDDFIMNFFIVFFTIMEIAILIMSAYGIGCLMAISLI